MRISYNKLWKMLIDKNMKKSDLKEKAGISCEAMDCRIEDILETVRD